MAHPLAHLQEQSVASLLLDGHLDSLRVGDGQIITDNLDLVVGVEVGPSLDIVLLKGVFDGADVVFLDIALVDFSELGTGEPLGFVRVGVLAISYRPFFQTMEPTLKSKSYLPSL